MLPRIKPKHTIARHYRAFLKALRASHYQGEIATDYAARLTMAIDNSIYQVTPEAVIYPRSTQDVAIVLQLAQQKKFREIKLSPRGGGTGTDGQSLSAGIIIDCSKYMCHIIELNLKQNWVRVQPGVVLDQLNVFLKPHGLSFPIEISTSNRATIGGMVNTDACGVGSRVLGRTSDHIIDLTCILMNGQVIHSSNLDKNHELYQNIVDVIHPHQKLIDEKFTSAPRTLSGYNLKKAYISSPSEHHFFKERDVSPGGILFLNYLFSGSEGTLAVVGECKLKLSSIPKYKKVIIVKYENFTDALRAEEITEDARPLVIEAIDEKLIDLARQDASYFHIKEFLDGDGIQATAINIVEFVSNNEEELTSKINHFCKIIIDHKNHINRALGYYIAKNSVEEKLIWELRKKSVGLISKKQDGTRRPIPFIEDTAVPPEQLASYMAELKTLLDQYKLIYGMYGHVDAGCIHVRPALDMKIQQDEKLIRELTNQVVILTKKYGGVLWGEHGQGFRTEYAEQYFGETLSHAMRQIKTIFDPYNQLNPGKVAISLISTEELVKIDGPMRAQFDKQIPKSWRKEFDSLLACNGNGACFSYATTEVMCPSFKVTKNRLHSPKGRATVMREWLRLVANKKFNLNPDKHFSWIQKLFNGWNKKSDFSQEVYTAMSGCLGCKACETQCPLSVNVPEFKSKFIAYYHQRYLRSIKDYMIASIEYLARIQSKWPRAMNWLLRLPITRFIFRYGFGIVDVPTVSVLSAKKELKKRGALLLDLSRLMQLNDKEKSKSVILLQDIFTTFYDSRLVLDVYDFLKKLGFTVYVVPYFANGKPWQVEGFLKKFARTVNKNNLILTELAKVNIPLVGIDPSITLTYRDEYQKVLGKTEFKVMLLQEWLMDKISNVSSLPKKEGHYYLLSHCTEKTLCVQSEKLWQSIFSALGLQLMPLAVGCCGMAGGYGHEVVHEEQSKELFKMDWQRCVKENKDKVLVTGYSCRSQVMRMMGVELKHPIQALSDFI